MNTQEHLQQLIGTLAIQLAEKCAQVDAMMLEIAELKAIPKRGRKAKPNGSAQGLDSREHGHNGFVPTQP